MMRTFLFAFLFLVTAGLVQADETIWSGLVYATNRPTPQAPPPEIARYAPQMQKVFGYNQFELIGKSRQRIYSQTEHWLVPGEEFSLRLKSHRQKKGKYEVDLELWRKKQLLVRSKAAIEKESPLIFRGPLYRDGQLIIVLMIR